jgi:hypothetical protein
LAAQYLDKALSCFKTPPGDGGNALIAHFVTTLNFECDLRRRVS